MFQLSFFQIILLSIINILFVLIAVAYYTLAERKIMAAIQRRRGPNVVGIWGLLQPLADGLKAVLKEIIVPRKANKIIFLGAPILTLVLGLAGWIVIPFNMSCFLADINLGLLYLFALSSLNVYSIIFAGWSSNSKYAFLGGLRSAAQMISYEVALGLIILPVVLCVGSFNLTDIVLSQRSIWFIFPLFPLALIFFISSLAETNRAPFDLPEAEAELVAGYNVEYSSITFAMFFLSEYSNMLLMSSLNTILFLGGWLAPFSFLTWIPEAFWFSIKVTFYSFVFVWIRAAFPRFRYDQLMNLGWKVFLPITLGYFIFVAGILFSFEQETGTVIYTSDGIVMIACLSNVQQSSRNNNIRNRNARNCVRKFQTGRRFLSTSRDNQNLHTDQPQPIVLPNSSLVSIIFHSLYSILLFMCFSGHNFLVGVIIQCFLLFIVCCYYIGFAHKDRFLLFWSEIFNGIKTQPKTLTGIIAKWRLLNFGWWASVLHIFFYTQFGYIVWSTSTALSIIFSYMMYYTFDYIPVELAVLWSISSAGLTSAFTCYFLFWYEKKAPFLYQNIKKSKVLLLVENPTIPAAIKFFKKAAGPVVVGTVAAASSYVFTTQSNDNARVKMYGQACDFCAKQGEPLPDPGPFLRNNPSISGEGAVGGNKGILNVGVKVQK